MMIWLKDNFFQNLVIFYIIVMVISGYRKGFLRIIFSMFITLLAIGISYNLSPKINDYLLNNTNIKEGITSVMLKNIGVDDVYYEDYYNKEKEDEIISSLNMSEGLKKVLKYNNKDEVYVQIGVNKFKDYLYKYISVLILKRVIFVLVFVFSIIILNLILEILNIFSKIPIISGINSLAGAVVGFFNAMFILWILSLFIGAIVGTNIGSQIMEYIKRKPILLFIFNNNLISYIVRNVLYTFIN